MGTVTWTAMRGEASEGGEDIVHCALRRHDGDASSSVLGNGTAAVDGIGAREDAAEASWSHARGWEVVDFCILAAACQQPGYVTSAAASGVVAFAAASSRGSSRVCFAEHVGTALAAKFGWCLLDTALTLGSSSPRRHNVSPRQRGRSQSPRPSGLSGEDEGMAQLKR